MPTYLDGYSNISLISVLYQCIYFLFYQNEFIKAYRQIKLEKLSLSFLRMFQTLKSSLLPLCLTFHASFLLPIVESMIYSGYFPPFISKVFFAFCIRGHLFQNRLNITFHHPLLRVESRQVLNHSPEPEFKERSQRVLGLLNAVPK